MRDAPLPAVGILISLLLSSPVPAAEDSAFFEKEVRPLLVQKCFRCHGPKKQESGLRLDSRDALLRGGQTGPAVVPDQPQNSLLLRAVRHQGDLRMPPNVKLTEIEISALTRWVQAGAPWPKDVKAVVTRGAEITPDERRFWSFQPVRRSDSPSVQDARWCRNPVDRFILARLEARGLKPVATADRQTLIRRATFDLIGLPPLPEEVAVLLNDQSPHGFTRVVARLL